MLEFALKYKTAINAFTGDREMNLRKYELTSQEWTIVQQLHDVLKIFKDATYYFSKSTPSLAKVIPAMDHINAQLATMPTFPQSAAALSMGKKLLNKYYDKINLSEVYRIAMVLHPQYKLEYFKSAKWPQDWIDTACRIVEDEFEKAYVDMEIVESAESSTENLKPDAAREPENIFEALSRFKKSPAASELFTELEIYLATPTKEVKNAVKWWYKKQPQFPRLS
ncbi:hypothetical protein C0991_011129 [Blastosporella zonata]|nr:hypothetical protein C0991_011129 [Blastosporella zonata]